jgi:hypothetical protein
MSFGSLIRNGVALADKLTRNGALQSVIHVRRAASQDGYGNNIPGTTETVLALVDYTAQVINSEGESINIAATVTILDRNIDPIAPEDEITLPNGYVGPIISTPGAMNDPSGDEPFYQKIMIGKR